MPPKIFALAVLAAGAGQAEFLKIEVFMRDMNCQPCSDSLVTSFQKMRGVARAEVDFPAGTVRLELAPQNRVAIEQVWDIVKRVGFTPGETTVPVRGAVKAEAGKMALEVTETNRALELEGGHFTAG